MTLEFEVRCRKLFPLVCKLKTWFSEIGMVQRFWICEIKINYRKTRGLKQCFCLQYNLIFDSVFGFGLKAPQSKLLLVERPHHSWFSEVTSY